MSTELTTFVCGVKPDHEHVYDKAMMILRDDSLIEETPENIKEFGAGCAGMTTVCSICGHAAIDDAWMLP